MHYDQEGAPTGYPSDQSRPSSSSVDEHHVFTTTSNLVPRRRSQPLVLIPHSSSVSSLRKTCSRETPIRTSYDFGSGALASPVTSCDGLERTDQGGQRMRSISAGCSFLLAFATLGLSTAQAQMTSFDPNEPVPRGALGVHGAIGTDVELGLGFGVGATYLLPGSLPVRIEVGGQLFFAHSEYTDTEGIHDYTETTDLQVFAVRVNALWNYTPWTPGLYYILGTGAAGVYVDWEERSPTDTSLGTPLDNGGSKHQADGADGAVIANAGIGYTFGGGLDARLELPILIFARGVGEAAGIAPTVTASAGFRF